MAFVHLHAHMEGSYSDSPLRHEAALDRVRELGMPAFALTDHGELAMARPFTRAAAARGIKPILGFEAYFVPDAAENIRKRINDRYHLLLLAKNATGWANLRLIASSAWMENCLMQKLGLVDWGLLERHHEGIVCLTACLAGPVGFPFLDGRGDIAEKHLERLRDIFGQDLYIEIYRHGMEEEEKAVEGLLSLATRHNLPTVLTNDCHYLAPDDWRLHDVLIKTRFGKVSDFALQYHTYWVKSEAEMSALGFPREALDRTIEINEKITLTPEEILAAPTCVPLPAAAPRLALLGEIRPMGLAQAFLDASAVAGLAKKARERIARDLAAGDAHEAEKHAAVLAAARHLAGLARRPGADFARVVSSPDLPVRVPLRRIESLAVTMWPEEEVISSGAQVFSLEEAGKIDPDFARRARAIRFYREGLAAFYKKATAAAEAAYLLALEEDPSFSNARYELGRARYYAGHTPQARETFLDVLARDPAFERKPHLDSYLGWCHFTLGDFEAARGAFETSLTEKSIGGSFIGLARTFLSQGDKAKSRAILTDFLERHPEDRRAEEAKRLILNLNI